MRFDKHPVAAAVSLTLLLTATAAQAQSSAATAAPEKKAEAAQLNQVQVSGFRAALQQSIGFKKNADTNVEVVTSDDVGKMPDKNIADSLSRLPGVNVAFGGALAMDEGERIQIRGTSPNLNLVTVNGHALSSGDWHVGDQGSSGRSVGFGLMPAHLLDQAVVYKTGRADLTEGGIAGAVDIRTRKPLNFKNSLNGDIALGAVHADLPGKTDPQVSGQIAWQNDERNFGVLLQGFYEKRHLRRDGQETFSFGVISQAQATASGNPALAGLRMPGSLNSALFEGVRERMGGVVAVQYKPRANIDLTLTAFNSQLDADNYNSSAFALPTALVGAGWTIANPVIDGNTIVKADLVAPNPIGTRRVIGMQFDHNLREGAVAKSAFYDFDVAYRPDDDMTVRLRAGYTEGSGVTNRQPSLTFGLLNPNFSYQINQSRPTDYAMLGATGQRLDLSTTAPFAQMSNTGASVESKDSESYLHLDADAKLQNEVFRGFKYGVRIANHSRSYDVLGARWKAQDNADGTPVSPSPFVSVTGGLLVDGIVGPNRPVPPNAYPGNYAAGLDADFPRDLFRFDPAQMSAFANQYILWDDVATKIWTSGYTVKERNLAGYALTEFELSPALSGDVGARIVETSVTSTSYQALPNGTGTGQCVPTLPCSVPGAIVGSRFASYLGQTVRTNHLDILPSLNLRWAMQPDLIARFGLGRTLGRPNYNELAGAVSLNNTLLTGTSGNPLLSPITANNADANLAWYFASRGYLSGGIFYSSLRDYVKAGLSNQVFFNTSTGTYSTYAVSSRLGVDADYRGVELAGELPVGAGFGVSSNYTYIDGKDQDGAELLGTSKHTVNFGAFFENDAFTARVNYQYRTDYAIGFVGNGTTVNTTNAAGIVTGYNGVHKYAGYESVSLSLGWRFSKQLSLHFDANNLTNPVRHTYFISENAPGYWHQSGRQYYLTLRGKL